MKDTIEGPIELQLVEQNGLEQVYKPTTEKVQKLKPNVHGDLWNLFLLTVLYTLQSIPFEMTLALPVIMQSRGVSSADQGQFVLAFYPWNFKILWAPVVDFMYWKKLGRRKSWIVPTQYLLGISIFIMSRYINEWIGDNNNSKSRNIPMLTMIFFISNLLSAIQNVAVDGWSLTILKKENSGLLSLAISLAYIIGSLLGYALFIVLDSKDFCNKWLRSTPQDTGLLSFSNYLLACSLSYFVITTLILILKREESVDVVGNEYELRKKLVKSYSLLWAILKIKPVRLFILILLTYMIGLIPSSIIGPLKLIDTGYTTVTMALLKVAVVPFKCIILFLSNRTLVGEKCLYTFIKMVYQSMILGIFLAVSIFFIPEFRKDGEIQWWYSVIVLVIFSALQVWLFLLQAALQAAILMVSDSVYGGTYQTVLFSASDLGYACFSSLAFFMLDFPTIRTCKNSSGTAEKGKCPSLLDGFYVEVIVAAIIGFLWIFWARKKASKWYNYSKDSWLVQLKAADSNNLQNS